MEEPALGFIHFSCLGCFRSILSLCNLERGYPGSSSVHGSPDAYWCMVQTNFSSSKARKASQCSLSILNHAPILFYCLLMFLVCQVLCFQPSSVCSSGQSSYLIAFGSECLGPPAFLVVRWSVFGMLLSIASVIVCVSSLMHMWSSAGVCMSSLVSNPSSLHSNVFLTFSSQPS